MEEFFAESFATFFMRTEEKFIKEFDEEWYLFMKNLIEEYSEEE